MSAWDFGDIGQVFVRFGFFSGGFMGVKDIRGDNIIGMLPTSRTRFVHSTH
jgi:hypothetical protein